MYTLLLRRVVLRWPFAGRRPWLVLPLAVAVDAYGKRRLILDARFLNWFLQYLPLTYEQLQQLVAGIEQGHYIVVDDQHSGYHHARMAAQHWGLLGFELDGQLYVFTCLPFGLSQAPWVFTAIMQAVYTLPRTLGWNMVFMVDDSGMTAAARPLAQRSWAMAWLKAALGWVHSRHKCIFWPALLAKLLGFMVDMQRQYFLVPERKLERFVRDVRVLQQTRCPHLLASCRGQLASFKLAMLMAPLLARWLAEAARNADSCEPGEFGVDFLAFWADNVGQLNGRPWLAAIMRGACLKAFSDASERGYGAHALDAAWQLALAFSEADQARMDDGAFSSTHREVEGYHVLLQGLADSELLEEGMTLLVYSDSQPAVEDCQRMRGTSAVFTAVLKLYLLAFSLRVQLEFVWVPREHELLQLADALSKVVDPTDWALSIPIMQQQVFSDPAYGTPDIDCLASSEARVCGVYFAAIYDGKCAGVNGFAQCWASWPASSGQRVGKPLCWLFPPPKLLLQTLLKVRRERAEALVVCARTLQPVEEAVLLSLAARHKPLTAPHSAMVFPSRRVPREVRTGGWKTPLQVCRITWEEH